MTARTHSSLQPYAASAALAQELVMQLPDIIRRCSSIAHAHLEKIAAQHAFTLPSMEEDTGFRLSVDRFKKELNEAVAYFSHLLTDGQDFSFAWTYDLDDDETPSKLDGTILFFLKIEVGPEGQPQLQLGRTITTSEEKYTVYSTNSLSQSSASSFSQDMGSQNPDIDTQSSQFSDTQSSQFSDTQDRQFAEFFPLTQSSASSMSSQRSSPGPLRKMGSVGSIGSIRSQYSLGRGSSADSGPADGGVQ